MPLVWLTTGYVLAGCGDDGVCSPGEPRNWSYTDAPLGPGLVIDGGTRCAPPRLLTTGDVNGDGLADLILAADDERVFVVPGRTTPGRLDLADVAEGVGGFVIEPGTQGPLEWRAFGDVNGDGRLDLAARTAHDATIVVFGADSSAAIDLDDVAAGAGGLIIEHGAQWATQDVDAIVDIDGDGFDDVVFGGLGSVHVVFGAADVAAATLDEVNEGIGGFAEEITDQACGLIRVVPIGDFDGDGFTDLAATEKLDPDLCGIGPGSRDDTMLVRGRAPGVMPSPSRIYPGYDLYDAVVHGPGDLDGDGFADLLIEGVSGPFSTRPLSAITDGFIVYHGRPELDDSLGYAGLGVEGECCSLDEDWTDAQFEVRGSGDVNGDGRPDILVASGDATYVIFGPSDFDDDPELVVLEPSIAPDAGVHLPHTRVVPPADLDGDGIADLVFADSSAEAGRGQIGVLYGRADLASGQAVDSSLAGEFAGDRFGEQVEAADVNGDGLADLVVTAPGADPGGRGSGRVYVVFSAP